MYSFHYNLPLSFNILFFHPSLILPPILSLSFFNYKKTKEEKKPSSSLPCCPSPLSCLLSLSPLFLIVSLPSFSFSIPFNFIFWFCFIFLWLVLFFGFLEFIIILLFFWSLSLSLPFFHSFILKFLKKIKVSPFLAFLPWIPLFSFMIFFSFYNWMNV